MESRNQSLASDSRLSRFVYLAMSLLLMAALVFQMTNVQAKPVGTVVELSGPLFAKKADGLVKVLSINSHVEPGDLLESQKDTFARIRFLDDSEITLRPNTQFKIDQYSFEQAKPDNDRSVFTLIKGGLRSITGSLGKRNKERYQLNTPAATIGIRGTTYVAQYVPESDTGANKAECTQKDNKEARSDDCSDLKPGLYLTVLNGSIMANNSAGAVVYQAGQSGYTASSQQEPTMLLVDPNIKFDMPLKKLGSLVCPS